MLLNISNCDEDERTFSTGLMQDLVRWKKNGGGELKQVNG